MKNRDNFIDLMEEIDPRHLDEHVKKNTDTKSKRIKRYIAAAGIYAAACIAALILIPFIVNHQGDVPPNNIPGAEPVTTAPVTEENDRNIDEVLADTMLYKVLDAAGVDRKDVERLRVGREQIVHGSVYYERGSQIFRDNEPHFIMSTDKDMGDFRVGNERIIFTEMPDVESTVQKNLYSYNLSTGETNLICEDEILYFDFVDEELVYVTGDSRNPTEYKVYNYVNYSEESRLISTIPAEQNSVSSAYFNGHQLVVLEAYVNYESPSLMIYDIHKGEWKVMVSGANETRIAFADTGDGYYCSVELLAPYGNYTIVAKRYNGVWFRNPDTEEKELISGTTYSELYYVNGALVGVNGNEATVIIEKPTEEEKYGLEEGKLFPRPEVITISCEYDHYDLTSSDPLYEYFYEKINARVIEGRLQELTDRNDASPNKYRGDKEVYVEFKYTGDSMDAPFYPDKENAGTVFTPSSLFFPLTGGNTDTVLLIDSVRTDDSSHLILKCFGTLAEDPEIEAKIWEYFSYAAPEGTE